MSDESLVTLARHAEDMAANPNVPPAEKELWQTILQELNEYFAEPEPGSGLFDEDTT